MINCIVIICGLTAAFGIAAVVKSSLIVPEGRSRTSISASTVRAVRSRSR